MLIFGQLDRRSDASGQAGKMKLPQIAEHNPSDKKAQSLIKDEVYKNRARGERPCSPCAHN